MKQCRRNSTTQPSQYWYPLDLDNSKLDFRPGITPVDREWTGWRTIFLNSLRANCVQDVLSTHLTSAQQSYILLLPLQDDALRIQTEDGQLCKSLLKPGHRFQNVPDNLPKKPTMLPFWLPVQHVTINNILGCGKEEDLGDESDEEDEMPRTRGIWYSETPLEFLESYIEKSFGNLILRRSVTRYETLAAKKESSETLSLALVREESAASGAASKMPKINPPIFPQGLQTVFQRGGAGFPNEVSADEFENEDEDEGEGEAEEEEVERGAEGGKLGPSMESFTGVANLTESTIIEEDRCMLFGFSGSVNMPKNDPTEFLKGALNLIGRSIEDGKPWKLNLYCWSQYANTPDEIHAMTSENFFSTYTNKLQILLNKSVGEESCIDTFAYSDEQAAGGPFPGPNFALQPNIDNYHKAHDIVVLINGKGDSAYWKLPRRLTCNSKIKNTARVIDNATNEIQKRFYGAMRILFRDGRPLGPVKVLTDSEDRSFSLGIGGLELTCDLWNNLPKNHEPLLVIADPHQPGTAHVTLLSGGNLSIKVDPNNPEDVREKISDAISSHLNLNLNHPVTKIRIWRNRDDCEANVKAKVIDYSHSSSAHELGEFLGAEFKNAVFRPEWPALQISDLESKTSRKWDTLLHEPTLASFRGFLSNNLQVNRTRVVRIRESMDPDKDDNYWAISDETTEDEWRINIFNIINSDDIWIYSMIKTDSKKIAHEVNGPEDDHIGIHHWGAPARVPEKKSRNTPVLHRNKSTAKLGLKYDGVGSSTIQISKGSIQPRLNLPRIIATSTIKPKIKSWDNYMDGQYLLNGVQRKSYIKDQSIIQPVKEPMAPIYGQSHELMFRLSKNLPTVYAQRLTPTDVMQLYEENQYLRNRILDRETKCQICDEVFENYKIDEIANHYREHRLRLREDGQCAWCGDVNYGFMTVAQRRLHLQQHFNREDNIVKKQIWKDHRCPICDQDFAKWKSGEVIDHCLNKHSPGLAQFCDKCGVNTYQQTKSENEYHQAACCDQPDGSHGDLTSIFCEKCGKDTSHQTPDQVELHNRDCLEKLSLAGDCFCPICGILLITRRYVNINEVEDHQQHCKPPGGFKHHFCQRCGIDLKDLEKNLSRLASHKEMCYQKLDPALDATYVNDKIRVLDELKAKTTQREVRQDTLECQYWNRMRALKEREDGLSAKLKAQGSFDQAPHASQIAPRAGSNSSIAVNLDKCKFEGCSCIIGDMSRDEILLHYKTHATEGLKWNCPLRLSSGKRCSAKFDGKLVTYEEDIMLHFAHLHGDIQVVKPSTAPFLAGKKQEGLMGNRTAETKSQHGHRIQATRGRLPSIADSADDKTAPIELLEEEIESDALTLNSTSENHISDDDQDDPDFRIAMPQRPQRQIKKPKRYAVASEAAIVPVKEREAPLEKEETLPQNKGRSAKSNPPKSSGSRKRKVGDQIATSSRIGSGSRKKQSQRVKDMNVSSRTRSGGNTSKVTASR